MADPSEIVSAPLSGSRTLGGPDHASERKAIIETLLFVNGKPLTLDRLCEVLEEKNKQKVRALVAELQLDYETSGRALTIVEIAGGFQMTTRPLHASWVRKLAKVKMVSRVSRAALETAAIIAYKQPITRLEI